MNFYNHHNSVSFKSHSISVTFRFCAVLVALRALEPRSTDPLGTQHCANFESHSNRVTFETNAIMAIVKVHHHCSSKAKPFLFLKRFFYTGLWLSKNWKYISILWFLLGKQWKAFWITIHYSILHIWLFKLYIYISS